MIGQQILNYKIERLIGEGGMGKVYLAQHIQLNRKVAIKVLHSHLTYSQEFRNRFKTEANLLANLQHPNIVTLYDYVETQDMLALIMEYVEGKTLENFQIEEKYLIPIFHQVLDAFQYAHSKGIIHRDIKPANLVLQETHEGLNVKILDFGIAKIMDSLSKTQTGTQIGTILYMSPEQIKGQKVDIRSDIYSLGVTLFELATGKMPYNPNSSIYEVSNAIVHQPLPKPSSINPKINPMIEKAILKATEKNPDLRFQNCEEFKKSLQPIQNKKSLASTLSFWILILLVLSGLAFLAKQIYDRNQLNNDTLQTEIKPDNEQTDKILKDESNEKEKLITETQETSEEKLPERDFTDLIEGKGIKIAVNDLLNSLNNLQDFMELLDYKVKINQQEFTKPEAYQKLKEKFKVGISEGENSSVSYSLINNDFKIYSYEANSKEYLSFIIKKLQIRKNVKSESSEFTTFEDFDVKMIFNNKNFKIIEVEFLN